MIITLTWRKVYLREVVNVKEESCIADGRDHETREESSPEERDVPTLHEDLH